MNTPKDSPKGCGPSPTCSRFEVQHRSLQGWNTWVIYDEKRLADKECNRRISEAAPYDKNNWRVIEAQPLDKKL